MNLHLDKEAFQTLLLTISDRTGIRADIIEKDYYVTLMLFELSYMQKDLPAFFKGGTALYKALGSIKRFSEDIDLTVSIEQCNNNQAKRRLEKAAKSYKELQRDKEDPQNENHRGSITNIYHYDSVVNIDEKDALQRFGRIKVEATSFTVSEPHEEMTVSSVLYDYATGNEQQILENNYNVKSFKVETITLERIFVDKLFAAEFYWLRGEYFDVAKHVYDICELSNCDRIHQLFDDPNLLKELVSYKRQEEEMRIGSELANKDINQFEYFTNVFNDSTFGKEFERMQSIYVFNDNDIKTIDEASDILSDIYQELYKVFEIQPNQCDENELEL